MNLATQKKKSQLSLTGRGTVNHCTYERKKNQQNSIEYHIFAAMDMAPSFQLWSEQSVIFFSQLAKINKTICRGILSDKQPCLKANMGRDVCTDMWSRKHLSTVGMLRKRQVLLMKVVVKDKCGTGRPSDGISTMRALKGQVPLSLLFSASICIWTRRNPSLATPKQLSSDLANAPSLTQNLVCFWKTTPTSLWIRTTFDSVLLIPLGDEPS